MAQQPRKLNPYLLPIFLIVVVDVLWLTIVLPLLPFYAEHFGASPAVVGLLVTSFAVCQLVSGPFLGRVSDRMGRRPLLILSQVGTLIGFLILAWANSLWLVFLSRIIDGATAGNLSLAQAYISDVTEPKDRAKSFGLIGMAFGIGFLIGPAVSGYLSQFGYQVPIFAAAALSFTSIVCTTLFLPGDTHKKHAKPNDSQRLGLLAWGAYAEFFRRPQLARLLQEFLCFYFSFALFTSGFALFAERRFTHDGHAFGPKEVGYVFAYAGFLGVLFQGGLIGRLVKRFGEERLIFAGFLAAFVGYSSLAFARNVPELLLAATVTSFGHGSLRPCITSLITQKAGRHEQGTTLGLTQSLNSVAQIIAPLVAGLLIDRGWLVAWALCAGMSSLAGFALAASYRRGLRYAEGV